MVKVFAQYNDQVALLLRCLPALRHTPKFALKGGTALNLFIENMPRLSVDIDLAYLPVVPHEAALKDIEIQLNTIAAHLSKTIPGVELQFTTQQSPKLLVRFDQALVKIEVNPVIRGSVIPVVVKSLCTHAQTQYETYVEVQCLNDAELYAGKICAALDRQHPRDLFDLMLLEPFESISNELRQVFVVYLAAHSKPIAEMLAPRTKEIQQLFDQQFVSMTPEPVELAALHTIRERLFKWVSSALTTNERAFLLSIKRGEPDWQLLPYNHLEKWPAIQWKLRNIRNMAPAKHREAIARLEKVLASNLQIN